MFKRIYLLFIVICFTAALSGCAALYKFEKGGQGYDGYVVTRNQFVIPEYTLGKDDKTPEDIELARQRFKRRKAAVDRYYRDMELIAPPSYITFPKAIGNMATFIFRWPFIIVHELRYTTSDAYRKRTDERDEAQFRDEQAKRQKLKEELRYYIQNDIAAESGGAR